MGLLQIITLAIVQGLTEFLPVSSSAHLILLPKFVDWPDQGLAFDVSVHVGSLIAVVTYFHRDVVAILRAFVASILRRPVAEASADAERVRVRLAWLIILGTIPVCVVGLLAKDFIEQYTRSYLVIATTTLVFGVLLGIADMACRGRRVERDLRWTDALWIGLSQALAVIPGTSRSGATVTAGLFLGMTRTAAARFSFLLSIPTILIAGGYETLKLALGEESIDWTTLGLGAFFSCVCAYLCIHFFLKLLERVGMMPFVVYRLALGVLLLGLALNAPGDPDDRTQTARRTQSDLIESGVSNTAYSGSTMPSRR